MQKNSGKAALCAALALLNFLEGHRNFHCRGIIGSITSVNDSVSGKLSTESDRRVLGFSQNQNLARLLVVLNLIELENEIEIYIVIILEALIIFEASQDGTSQGLNNFGA